MCQPSIYYCIIVVHAYLDFDFYYTYWYYLVMFPRTRNSYGFMYVKEFGCTWCLLVNYEVGDLFFELNDNWETVRLEGKEGGGWNKTLVKVYLRL